MVSHLQKTIEDVESYPDSDYARIIAQLDKIKSERLVGARLQRDNERKLVENWFMAQKEQAQNDFQYARQKARNEFMALIQKQISSLANELNELEREPIT
ncbi:hypothetical protein CLU79DRAFT_841119 [Phycomyces nitens]|nr:hypothetical protein CLU79DRAFT_841119 [Phycomyces nitens]